MTYRSVSGGHYRRWLRVDEDALGPSNKQGHLISGEFFRGTDLLKRPVSVRRQEQQETMESLTESNATYGIPKKNSTRPSSSGKLLQLTPLWEHVVKNNQLPPDTDKDLLFAELATRMCDLEWEVRGHALRVLLDIIPVLELSELDRYMMPVMLKELTYNLGHSSPSVRKGALDALGVYLTQSTDPETVLRNIVVEGLEKQTTNNPAKGNIAMGVILSIPSLVNPLLSPTDGMVLISQTGLIHLVSALSKKLVQDTYQEQSLKTLVRIREMVGESRFDRFLEGFHPQCKKDFDILCQVYDTSTLGDSGIDLQATPQTNEGSLWSEGSSARGASSSTISPEDIQFRDQNQNLVFIGDKSDNSESIVDSTPSPRDEEQGYVDSVNNVMCSVEPLEPQHEVYTGDANDVGYESFRPVEEEEDVGIRGVIPIAVDEDGRREELEVVIEGRAVSRLDDPEEIESAVTVIEGEPMDEDVLNSSRVILETELQINEDNAIMMTILEDGSRMQQDGTYVDEMVGNGGNGGEVEYPGNNIEPVADDEGYRVYNNDYVMKVLTDDEDYDDNEDVAMADQPIRRTPRRVRFGGEMVMMRTPDSDEGSAQQEGDERQATIDQQEGRGAEDYSANQEVDNPGIEYSGDGGGGVGFIEEQGGGVEYIEEQSPIVEVAAEENGAIQAIISDSGVVETSYVTEESRQESVDNARRDSLVYVTEDGTLVTEDGTVLDITPQEYIDENAVAYEEPIAYTREDTLEDARQVDLESTKRDSLRRQDTVVEVRQDSQESNQQGSRQGSIENGRRSSIQESKQNSLENGRRSSIQEFRQDSLENGRRSSIQGNRQDSLENGRRSSMQGSRQNSLENSNHPTLQDIRRDSLDRKILDSRRDSLENRRRGSGSDSRQSSLEHSRLSSIQENRQNSIERRGSIQEIRRDSVERRDSIQESRRDSLQNGRQESIEGRLESIQESRRDSVDNAMRRSSIQEEIRTSVDNSGMPEIQERQQSIDNGRQEVYQETGGSGIEVRQDTIDDSTPAIEYMTDDTNQRAIQILPEDSQDVEELHSHIPLPVTPAKSIPRDHKRRGPLYRKRQKTRDSQTSSDSQQSESTKAGSVSGSEGDAREDAGENEEADESGDGDGGTEHLGPSWEDMGIVPERVIDDLHDPDEWVSRIHGIETLSSALKDPEVLHTVLPCMPSLLHCLLVTMAEDRNYRVAVSSIGAVKGLINSLPHAILQDHLQQIVIGLTRHVGGSGSVNLKIEAAQVAKNLMQIMKPNPVVEILLTSECIGAKSSKMRENSLLFLIYATLTFPSTEFHWDRMLERVAVAAADPRRRVRLAALDALSVIAQFATPSLLDEAVRNVAGKQPNYSTRIAYMAGVQARLARRQLPTTSQDGLILYVLQIPSARTSGKGSFSSTPIGSDVDWVLAGSGSLSSGSARSRAQLIAAQRLDPAIGVFPAAPDETPTVTVKSRWTERKGTVAATVQSRSQSATLAPIEAEKPPDEPRSRTSVTTWTTDLDGQNITASQRTSHTQIVRLETPPDVFSLYNDSLEKGSFSLLPNRLSHSTIVSRAEGVGHEQLNQTWPPPTSGRRSPRIPKKTSSKKRGRRILEPLNGSGSPRRGVSPAPIRRGTSPVPKTISPIPRGVSPTPRRVSPTPRRVSPTPRGVSPVPRGSPIRIGANSGGRHKIPPLSPRKKKEPAVASGFDVLSNFKDDDIIDLASLRKARRRKRSTNRGKGIIAIEHDPPTPSAPPPEEERTESSSAQGEPAVDDCTIPQKPMLARQGVRHDMSQAGMLTENSTKVSNGLFTPPAEPFLPPVDPATPQIARTQMSPPIQQQQDELEFRSLDENDVPQQEPPPPHPMGNAAESAIGALEAEERAFKFQLLKDQEQLESVTVSPISVASAPGGIEDPVTTTQVIELDNNVRGSVQSLQKSQTPPSETPSREEKIENVKNEHHPPHGTYTTGSIIDLHLDVEDALQNSVSVAPVRQTRRVKRGTIGTKNSGRTLRGMQVRDSSRSQQTTGLFPETLRPVEKPRESMQLCFAQLESTEWEVIIQGLQLLVRLMRHHPETIHANLHPIMVAVGKQVRNLRSQVARSACQASAELFTTQKRAVEPDVDELASTLLHRAADTNRFLRADSNAALDKMIEVISPSKAVSVITGKGVSHPNAIVRTASARLLVNLVTRVGVEKVMTHPGDMRDKILLNGANLLTEGSLDTRCFAKQLFRMLSSYPTFNTTMTEVIPPHILRNISKTLQNLK